MHEIALATLLVLAVAPVTLGAATSPAEQLKASIHRVLQILDDPALKPEARLAERRKEFIPLFADLVDRAYMSTIERYNGEPRRQLPDTVQQHHPDVLLR